MRGSQQGQHRGRTEPGSENNLRGWWSECLTSQLLRSRCRSLRWLLRERPCSSALWEEGHSPPLPLTLLPRAIPADTPNPAPTRPEGLQGQPRGRQVDVAQRVGAAEELLEGWWGLPALPVETLGSAREGAPESAPGTPARPPVGAAVARQVEVGEVGAAAVEQGTQKLRGKGEASQSSAMGTDVLSFLVMVLALILWASLCEPHCQEAHLACGQGSPPTHRPLEAAKWPCEAWARVASQVPCAD